MDVRPLCVSGTMGTVPKAWRMFMAISKCEHRRKPPEGGGRLQNGLFKCRRPILFHNFLNERG